MKTQKIFIIILFYILIIKNQNIEGCSENQNKFNQLQTQISKQSKSKETKETKEKKSNLYFFTDKVLKVIQNKNEGIKIKIEKEIKLIQNLNQYDILSINSCIYEDINSKENIFQKKSQIIFEMDYIKEENLTNLIEERKLKNESYIYKYDLIYKISQIIRKLHIKKLINIEIDSDNIFFLNKYTPILANLETYYENSKEKNIKNPYIAPEIKNNGLIGPEGDVFSLGILFWEILKGKKALSNSPDLSNDGSNEIYFIFKDLISRMIEGDSNLRPNIIEVEFEILNKLENLVILIRSNRGLYYYYDYLKNSAYGSNSIYETFEDYEKNEKEFYLREDWSKIKYKNEILNSFYSRNQIYHDYHPDFKIKNPIVFL